MMLPPRVLVAGIGNIFLGDDGFGSEVARRLLRRPRREGIRVEDFGIRGLDLAFALLDGCETAIFIDAVQRGEAPGTLFVIEPEPQGAASAFEGAVADPIAEGHGMDPVKVLRLVESMGGRPGRVLVVGCEPEPLGAEEDGRMELSPRARAAVEEAIPLVERLIEEALAGAGPQRTGG